MDADREPDLELELPLDVHAPCEARHAVGRVDRPSPDLRDAVMLLTSELITRALRHRCGGPGATVTVRVWMPPDLARVEVWCEPRLLHEHDVDPDPEYELMLLEETTDRWSIERREDRVCAWFEIDRVEPAGNGHAPSRSIQRTSV